MNPLSASKLAGVLLLMTAGWLVAPPATSAADDEPILQPREPRGRPLPAVPTIAPRSILGPDDRSQVGDTLVMPWRSVVRLIVKFPGSASTFGCTGTMVDASHVLTAGHCVYDSLLGGWPEYIEATPAQNGDIKPFGTANGIAYRAPSEWVNEENWQHDIGLITLDESLGALTGWTPLKSLSANDPIYSGVLTTAGYPCDKASGTQWSAEDIGESATQFIHEYYMDTFGCQSGSPVWYYNEGTKAYQLITVHTYGSLAPAAGAPNAGTRLAQDKFEMITAWLAEDAPEVEDCPAYRCPGWNGGWRLQLLRSRRGGG